MTKEQERNELHKTIWQIANDLRGSVDGWDFKAYVLGMLFYRFISENLATYLNRAEHDAGNADFDYAAISDEMAEFGRADTVREKGFYILPSELFVNVRARAKEDPNLNETMSRVFQNIENSAKGTASEDDLQGLFDDIDVNSNKLGSTVAKRNELLVKILNAIGDLRLGTFTDNTIDAFGDAYEFLMTMYASSAGKSGGRVLHAAGGFRAARADRGRGQDGGEQGLRPGLRLGFAALEVREVAGREERAAGILRAGDQSHDLQPLPDQHVPAQRQL